MSLKTFVNGTIQDFKRVWVEYPNVVIWSGLLGIVLLVL